MTLENDFIEGVVVLSGPPHICPSLIGMKMNMPLTIAEEAWHV